MESGASVLHLHVRDAEGVHSLDCDRYREAIAHVRAAVADRMLIQVTTEAVGRYLPAQQMEVVQSLRPEAASVAIRELIPDEAHLPQASRFFEWSAAKGVALQFIVYGADEAARLVQLARQGALGVDRPNALFVLGRYSAGQPSAPTDLLPFLAAWPLDFPWSVCAFGSTEAQCVAAALGLGGHARVGFENNLVQASGQQAEGNADLVANVSDLIRGTGRRIASVAEARAVYGAAR
jgi:3-keto-5-aminohexanoate cleavage enzyme